METSKFAEVHKGERKMNQLVMLIIEGILCLVILFIPTYIWFIKPNKIVAFQ